MKTSAPTIAVMSPGDMGHAVGALLRRHGLRVITSLEGRSSRTESLAAKAGIDVVADRQALVDEADLLLSILVPAEAEPLARQLAPLIGRSASDLTYVDCNAIAPETALGISGIVEAAGGSFVDAGIIGPPPRESSAATRFYASGKEADRLAVLKDHGLDVRVIGDTAGQASAVKMCYAALTKGTTALMTGLSIAAERMGVRGTLRDEFELSQTQMLERMRRHVPGMVPKAHRWVGEMEEIAKTFQASGLTPKLFEGAAGIYRDVAKDPLAQVTQEEWNNSDKSYENVIEMLAQEK